MSHRPQTSFDAVIAGGGVIGLACAWRLARRGASVCLLERDRIGSGASGVAAGMLAPVGEANAGEEGLLELNLASLRAWPAFAADLDADSDCGELFERMGSIRVAVDRDEAEEIRWERRLREARGLEVSTLTARECRELEPGLSPRTAGGFHAPDEAAVDPSALLPALATAARAAGAEIAEGEAVAGMLGSDSRIEGVRSSAGRELFAARTILATGSWSGSAEWLPPAHRPEVRPVKGQIATLGPVSSMAGERLCRRIVATPRVYLVPRRDGRVVVGATVEERGFDSTVTAGAVHELLREAYRVLPDVAEMELLGVRAGLRPATPSGEPLIGEARLPGLVHATGHYRNGVLLAPVTAEAVCGIVAGAPAAVGARS